MKRSAFSGLLLLGLIMGCLHSTSQGLYERSVESIARGNYDQGISGLDRTIKAQPEFPEAYVNRGIAYAEIGQLKEAIADYGKAIEINPELVDAYYNIGNVLMQLKDYDEAIVAYNEVISRDTSYGVAFGNRGNAYRLVGETEKAIVDIEVAVTLFAQQNNAEAESVARSQLAKLKQTQSVKPLE